MVLNQNLTDRILIKKFRREVSEKHNIELQKLTRVWNNNTVMSAATRNSIKRNLRAKHREEQLHNQSRISFFTVNPYYGFRNRGQSIRVENIALSAENAFQFAYGIPLPPPMRRLISPPGINRNALPRVPPATPRRRPRGPNAVLINPNGTGSIGYKK
jgi:hypothetical protein